MRRSLLVVEKDAVLDAQRHGVVGDAAGEALLRDIDARAEAIGAEVHDSDD